MLIRNGLWSVEPAKTWLLGYEWRAAIATPLRTAPILGGCCMGLHGDIYGDG